MRFMKMLAATALVVVPTFLATVPAEALTAKQYQHQGRGIYLNSTGSRVSRGVYRHHRMYHRHVRHHRRYR